jgi:sigma-B regulation protein RsbU (phosphoserine phosphatase)
VVDDSQISVLLIEDSRVDERRVRGFLDKSRDASIVLEHRPDLKSGLERLCGERCDVVLLDLNLEDSLGLDTLRRVIAARQDVPVVVLTGIEEDEQALQAVREGAADYLMKHAIDAPLLLRSIRYAIERRARQRMEATIRVSQYELEIARQIQAGLYPKSFPQLPGYDIAGASRLAAAVGGDYFDFFFLPDSSLGIAIGDAMGHGIGPALLAAETRAALRALMPNTCRVEELLAAADHVLRSENGEVHMITLFLAQLVPETGLLAHASAGHEPGLVFDADGQFKAALDSTAFPLGTLDDGDYRERAETSLSPGDILVLLTDGVREACPHHSSAFGRHRVAEIVASHSHDPASQIVDALGAAVWDYCQPYPPADDFTVIVVKVSPDIEFVPAATGSR